MYVNISDVTIIADYRLSIVMAPWFRLLISIFIIDCRCEKPPHHQQINELCIKWCISPTRKSSDTTTMDIKHKSETPQIEYNTCGVESKQILKQDWGIWYKQLTLLCLPIYNFILQTYSFFSHWVINITVQGITRHHVLWWMGVCVLTLCARRCTHSDVLLFM